MYITCMYKIVYMYFVSIESLSDERIFDRIFSQCTPRVLNDLFVEIPKIILL